MSELHVRQIRAAIEQTTLPHVDLADLTGRPENEITDAGLTRGLAAFVLSYIAEISPEESCAAITDGFGDNGIDAVYYHVSDRALYLVQSKWRHDGQGSVPLGDVQKFTKGFRDLINARWGRFNEQIKRHRDSLESALNDAQTRIVLVLTYSGQDPLGQEASESLKDLLSDINNPTEIVTLQVFRQTDVYAAVSHGISGTPINVDIALYEWGQVQEPYSAIYGQVSASDIAQWYSSHQLRLFSPNIRMFLGSTDVNEGIVGTIESDPEDFWYFNNGITALCRNFRRKPIGGDGRAVGIFECEDIRIVNGAQTVGAIAQAGMRSQQAVGQARVPIRIISLQNCPDEFAGLVTRFNNTQNRIDRRDFVALDPTQERLRGELQLEGITYVYKSGDVLSAPATGCDLVEATVARACSQESLELAVQAKREIGRLWEDIKRAPYKILFNGSVNGPGLWRIVQVLREIDSGLSLHRRSDDSRRRLLAVHGNRFLAHMVFQSLPPEALDVARKFGPEMCALVQAATSSTYERAFALIEERYPDAYLASLFKNHSKCQDLKDAFNEPGSS